MTSNSTGVIRPDAAASSSADSGERTPAYTRAEEMIRAELLVPPQELQEADDPDQPGPLAEVIEAWRDVTTEGLDR